MMKHQQGFTFLGFVFTLAVVIAVGLLTLKVVPVYLENYAVRQSIAAMDKLNDEQASTSTEGDIGMIKSRLQNQFSINGLHELDDKHLVIEPTEKSNNYRISVNYQVIKPLFYNVSLLFVFHESQEITLGKGE